MLRALALSFVIAGCAPGPEAGADAGAPRDAGVTPPDAGREEGQPCLGTSDCAAGLSCLTQVSGSGTTGRCSSCTAAGLACGDGGVCLTQVQGASVAVVCSLGRPGDPCATDSHCRAGACVSTVTAGGTTQKCE